MAQPGANALLEIPGCGVKRAVQCLAEAGHGIVGFFPEPLRYIDNLKSFLGVYIQIDFNGLCGHPLLSVVTRCEIRVILHKNTTLIPEAQLQL
jgi:hypothetical protein